MYNIKKRCKISVQKYPNQLPTYRLGIPIVFTEIMGLSRSDRFELELVDSDTIIARRVRNEVY